MRGFIGLATGVLLFIVGAALGPQLSSRTRGRSGLELEGQHEQSLLEIEQDRLNRAREAQAASQGQLKFPREHLHQANRELPVSVHPDRGSAEHQISTDEPSPEYGTTLAEARAENQKLLRQAEASMNRIISAHESYLDNLNRKAAEAGENIRQSKERVKSLEQQLRQLHQNHTSNYRPAAYEAAKYFVKQKLIAPASAIFPPISEVQVFGEYQHWMIRGYVDAQNRYGAWLRTNYEAKFDLQGSNFRLHYVKLL